MLCEFTFIESVNIFLFSFKHVFGKYASSESSGRKRRVARERRAFWAFAALTIPTIVCRGQDRSECSRRVRAHEKFLSVQVI